MRRRLTAEEEQALADALATGDPETIAAAYKAARDIEAGVTPIEIGDMSMEDALATGDPSLVSAVLRRDRPSHPTPWGKG